MLKIKILIVYIAQFLIGCFSVYAHSNENTVKPEITREMCAKLWYGCQCYGMAKNLFYHTMGADNIMENDKMMERMKNGDQEIAENFIHAIQSIYDREDSWANFKLFGFNYEELTKADDLFSYYENIARNNKRKKQEQQYKEWLENGVPSNVKPSTKAKLYCDDEESVISFFNTHQELFKDEPYKIRVYVGPDNSIRLVDSGKSQCPLIYSNLHLQIKEPAYYSFDEINKELPMGSIVDINLSFDLINVASQYYGTEFEASTKYEKKSDTWSLKITKDYVEKFDKTIEDDKEAYLNAIENALRRESTKPKKYVKFNLYNVRVWLTYVGDDYHGVTNYSLISENYLNPVAIITKSQSGFSRFQNN